MFTATDENLNHELQDLFSRLLHDQKEGATQFKVDSSDLLIVLKAVMDIQDRLAKTGR